MAEHQALLLPIEEAQLKTAATIHQIEDQATQPPQTEATTIAIATITRPEVILHQALIVRITVVAAVVEARDRLAAVEVAEDHMVEVAGEEDNIFFL